MPRITVHGAFDYNRSILFREDSGQISELANTEKSAMDGIDHVGHSGLLILHINLWMGALYWLSRSVARRMYRPISKGMQNYNQYTAFHYFFD